MATTRGFEDRFADELKAGDFIIIGHPSPGGHDLGFVVRSVTRIPTPDPNGADEIIVHLIDPANPEAIDEDGCSFYPGEVVRTFVYEEA